MTGKDNRSSCAETLLLGESNPENNNPYRLAFDHAPVGICFTSLDGSFLKVNQALCDLLGYSADELLRMNFRDITNPEDMDTSLEALEQAQNSPQGAVGFQRRCIGKSGKSIWVSIQANLVNDADAPLFITHIVDITDMKEAEERYREMARFPEENPNPVMRVRLDGTIVYANAASNELLAKTSASEGGELPEEIKEIVRLAAEDGRARDKTLQLRDKRLSILIVPYLSTGHANLYSRDMTEQYKLQEQIRLSQNVESLGRLAGGIAHDLNNLLLPIMVHSESALSELHPGDSRYRDMKQIYLAAEKARDLTRQLVAFGRKQVLQTRVLNLNETVQSSESLLRRLVRENVEIFLYLAPDLGFVKADPSQIDQILINLAINAHDAMPDGGKLSIETSNVFLDETYARTHPGTVAGRYVALVVSDSGCGMTPEVAARVFEPFFTTKGEEKGIGLGLSTVYGIVKQHQGNVWAYSEPGEGATFKIYLPRTDEMPEARDEVEPSAVHPGSETVLVVEDEAVVRHLVVSVLRANGYNVFEAATPEEALSLGREHPQEIELLLTDVIMPQMNGLQLHDRLREICPHMKVVYMSGYTNNVIAQHGMLEPGVHFVQKPFSVKFLLEELRRALRDPGT